MCWWMKIISHSPLWTTALLCPLCAPHNTCASATHWCVSFFTHLCLQLVVSHQTLFSSLVLASFMAIAALLVILHLSTGTFTMLYWRELFLPGATFPWCSWALISLLCSFYLVADSRDNTMYRIWPREKLLSLYLQTCCADLWGYQTLVLDLRPQRSLLGKKKYIWECFNFPIK